MVSRYGVKVRKKVQAVAAQKKTKYECPNCGKKSLKRSGNSLWICSSCKFTLAGGAYTPTTVPGISAMKNIQSRK
ncbi:50S ribosomal protein L37ae [Candidatus Micrarchaeota archaeon]|nr:50S ribosomal protein L37ae [Candidatus Micrarchaeota archaeon]